MNRYDSTQGPVGASDPFDGSGSFEGSGSFGAIDGDLRRRAVKRLAAKRQFYLSLAAYVFVNALLIVVWAAGDQGFFWPIFVLLGWGIGLCAQGINAFGRGSSEESIRREMDRLSRR